MNRLQEKYKNVVVPQMMKDFEYKSVMEVPHVEKVVINIGVKAKVASRISTKVEVVDGKNVKTRIFKKSGNEVK